MKFKKTLTLAAMSLAAAMLLSGCMNTANEAPAASPTAQYMPQGAAGSVPNAGNTGAATQQNAAAFDWKAGGEKIETQLGQISEVSEARVAVVEQTALVGVKFAQAYQGELTERIREMVAADIMAADPQITTVAVTSDPEDVKRVYELSDQIRAGEDMAKLKEDINEIVRNATTLR